MIRAGKIICDQFSPHNYLLLKKINHCTWQTVRWRASHEYQGKEPEFHIFYLTINRKYSAFLKKNKFYFPCD